VTKRNESSKLKSDQNEKLQDLLPPDRERIHQGQQFDEMQRQHKQPDGASRDENES
jgi:hypothetical protein